MFLTSGGFKCTLPIEEDGNGHGCMGARIVCVHQAVCTSLQKVWQKMLAFSLHRYRGYPCVQ